MIPYFVYILECFDKSFYTGITWNLAKRVREHNLRIKSPLQKCKVPVKLVYWKVFDNIYDAAKREKEIKGWSRIKKENLIKSLH